MKKILMAAVTVAAIATASGPVMAQTTAVYTVTGSVTAICSASTTGTIAFGNLTDANGTLNAGDLSATADTGAYCNGAGTKVQVDHVNLTNTTVSSTVLASPPSGFTGTVAFIPEITAGATVLSGNQPSTTVLGAFSGLTVKAKTLTTALGAKPLAGSYSGSITVTLSPLA